MSGTPSRRPQSIVTRSGAQDREPRALVPVPDKPRSAAVPEKRAAAVATATSVSAGPYAGVHAVAAALTRLSGLFEKARLIRFRAPRLRLLQGLIFTAVLMIGIRTHDLVNGIGAMSFEAGRPSQAEAVEPGPDPQIPPPDAVPAAPVVETPTEAPGTGPVAEVIAPQPASESEAELLRDMAERRKALEERERQLGEREAILAATEQRLGEKMVELTALRGQIEELLGKIDEQTDRQLTNLVGIYENMRPADAAAIFDGLDLDVLIDVLDRMKDQKSAAILAGMNPERAREVTTELASRRQLPVAASQSSAAPSTDAGDASGFTPN